MSAQAKLLFVDDEQRVLTAMRAMFRKDYEVHLASSGAEALALIREHQFDVVVSDQRMPEMTGVEVLREAREIAPQSMRILLTGYADLAAIESAINESEVFRYLMKPCPREQLRETVALAVEAVRDLAAVSAPVGPFEVVDTAVESDGQDVSVEGVELMVLSGDSLLCEAVRDAVGGQWPVHPASDVESAIKLLAERPIGVLITDAAVDERGIASLTAELKRHVPELVTIVASKRSDAHLLINLINHGEVFRFLLKPVSIGQCRLWLASAVNRHEELVSRPGATGRHRVIRQADTTGSPAAETGGWLSGMRRLRGRLLRFGRRAE